MRSSAVRHAPARKAQRGFRSALITLASVGIVVGGGATLSATPAPSVDAVQAVSVTAPVGATSLVSAPTIVLHGTPGVAAAGYLSQLELQHPSRLPFSAGEQAAAEWIASELAAIGFTEDQVSVQEFDRDSLNEAQAIALERLPNAGELDVSQNVIVRIPSSGEGTVILGASYDTFNADDVAAEPGTGSNVALLLETARNLHDANLPHTTYFGFFGAESAALAGSHHFYNSLPAADRYDIRLVANIDQIGNAETLFFTADVCDGGERCEERSEIFGEMVTEVAAGSGSDVVLFKDEDFEFLGEAPTCPCCIFGVPTSLVGVPVVNFFAFDFASDTRDAVSSEVSTAQTARALGTYQTLIQALLRADLAVPALSDLS